MNARLSAGLLLALSAVAQIPSDLPQCSRDTGGNRICIRTQPDANTCGYAPRLFGAQRPTPLLCDDVVVEKSTSAGRVIFTRVLSGESEDIPRQLFIDDRGNISVLGTTWSSKFPVTPDAAQSRYAGPAPIVPSVGQLGGGGDLFLTVLSPAGDVLYSSFLGSPGSDEITDIEPRTQGQFDLLVNTPDLLFPVASVPSIRGPVLLTIDMAKHSILQSQYLPAGESGQPAVYSAQWLENGTARVVTPSGVFTYSRDGRSLTRASLSQPQFSSVPTVTADSSGDLWLSGLTASGEAQLIRLAAATHEAFRWKVPAYGSSPSISAPFFGPKGLVYVGGYLGYRGGLRSTTSNAMLQAPCRDTPGYVAVFNRDDELKLLSYFLDAPKFLLEKNGTVSAAASWDLLNRLPVDLSERPKIGCVSDALRSFSTDPLALGQMVLLRGGGFGPRTPVAGLVQSGRFTKRLEGVRVRIDDIDAPILAIASGEAIVTVPYGVRTGTVSVTVDDGGDRSLEFQVLVKKASPQVLGNLFNEDGSVNSSSAPARWGSTVSFWVTAAGPYTPSLADGEIATGTPARRLELPVSVSLQINSPATEAGEVTYAGPVSGLIGAVSRVAFRLPRARPYPYQTIVAQVTIGSSSFILSLYVRE